MTEFENVLQDCLLSMERGDANLEDCLRRYPTYAVQLAPVLLTSVDLELGAAARPSAAFKARVRSRLIEEMRAHPRRSVRFHFMRMAVSFTVMLLALLAAGTVYAQGALPGNPFYGWKLASESVWRMLSLDPVATDLTIAERRADELLVLGNNLQLRAQVLQEYLEVVNRLELELNADNEARIRAVLDAQREELNKSGIVSPQLEQHPVPDTELSTPVPTMLAPVATVLPQMNPALPTPLISSALTPESAPAENTVLPKIVPTVPVPPLLP